MKSEYVITSDKLNEKGLNLDEYALDGTYVPIIIYNALDILITRMCFLNDNLDGEEDIEVFLDNNPKKLNAFLKAQYRVIYNLIFMGETSPTDNFVDNIVVFEMGLGKINGFQKGIHRG